MARISYVKPEDIKDPDLRQAMHDAMLKSTPRPEIQAIRAQQPEVMRAFIYTWERLFKGGVVDTRRRHSSLRWRSTTLGCNY